MGLLIRASAHVSDDGVYRYSLLRDWSTAGTARRVCWVMLNPSTADGEVDDPTIRRCIRFSQDWGYASLEVVNLYALRATDPRALLTALDPSGPDNRAMVMQAITCADLVVAAWGTNKAVTRTPLRRDIENRDPWCLGVTKAGRPKHPLYVPADTQPVRLSYAWTVAS